MTIEANEKSVCFSLSLLQMLRNDGKVVSSVPVHVTWPGVTIPKTQAICHACKELMISWGDSTSINDGNTESYTVCFAFACFREENDSF